MKKDKFSEIVKDGIDRRKNFMVVKIEDCSKVNPLIVIVQGEDIYKTAKFYEKQCDDYMIFNDSGNRIVDVLMTSNLNDLSWFAY